MADPLELSCEKLAVELLRASSGVLTVVPQIVTQSEDTDAERDRIVCACRPREVEATGRALNIVKVWRLPLEVRLYYSGGAAGLASVIHGIEAAIVAAPSSALDDLINGALLKRPEPTDEGDFSNEDNTRKRSKVWNFFSELV